MRVLGQSCMVLLAEYRVSSQVLCRRNVTETNNKIDDFEGGKSRKFKWDVNESLKSCFSTIKGKGINKIIITGRQHNQKKHIE